MHNKAEADCYYRADSAGLLEQSKPTLGNVGSNPAFSTIYMRVIPHKIFGDKRSEESIKLIDAHLAKLHKDKDANSLWCRFNEILGKIQDLEMDNEATFNHLIKVIEENSTLKKKVDI